MALLPWRRDGKPLLRSKTFWANILALGVGAIGYLTGVVPTEYVVIVQAAQALLNIVIRTWFTEEPINSVG